MKISSQWSSAGETRNSWSAILELRPRIGRIFMGDALSGGKFGVNLSDRRDKFLRFNSL